MNSPRRSRRNTFRVEGLEARALLSTLVVESEPNNRASQADVASLDPSDGSATLGGTISSRRDQDFYSLTATETGTLALAALTDGTFAARVSVEDAQGRKLLETEPRDGVNVGAFPINAGQTYVIRVRPDGRGTGAYGVMLLNLPDPFATPGGSGQPGDDRDGQGADDPPGDDRGGHGADDPPGDDRGGGRDDGPGDDRSGRGGDDGPGDDRGGGGVGGGATGTIAEAEPNDEKSAATAFALDSDGLATLTGTSSGQRDRDFFVFTAGLSGTLGVAVEANGGPIAKLEIEDASGRTLFETEPNNGVNMGTIAVDAGTTIYVRIRARDRVDAPYRVTLRMI